MEDQEVQENQYLTATPNTLYVPKSKRSTTPFHTTLIRILRHHRRRRLFLLDLLVIFSMLLTPFSSIFSYSAISPLSATSVSAAVPTGKGAGVGSNASQASQASQAPRVPGADQPSHPQLRAFWV